MEPICEVRILGKVARSCLETLNKHPHQIQYIILQATARTTEELKISFPKAFFFFRHIVVWSHTVPPEILQVSHSVQLYHALNKFTLHFLSVK